MNKKLVFLTLVLMVVSFTRCEKKKNPTVTLLNGSFITTDSSTGPGGLLKFKWEASKGKTDLSSFSVLMDGTPLPGFPKTGIPTDVYIDSVYLEGPAAKRNYAFSFQATDTEGKTGDRSLVITIE
jgi:hypothetical protein